jgi:hypothetical protein
MYSSIHSLPRRKEEVGGQNYDPSALPLGKTRYPLYRRLGGPQGRSGLVLKISPPPGIFLSRIRFCSYLVLHCSGIGLSMFFLYRTLLFLDFKGRLVGVIINRY